MDMQLLLRPESFDGGLDSFIQNTAKTFAKIRQIAPQKSTELEKPNSTQK